MQFIVKMIEVSSQFIDVFRTVDSCIIYFVMPVNKETLPTDSINHSHNLHGRILFYRHQKVNDTNINRMEYINKLKGNSNRLNDKFHIV